MQFLVHYLCRRHRPHRHQQHHRSLVDVASIKHLRDRGLEHAAEREKHLKPVINIKNLVKSEPSKSLPLSVITQNKDTLKIPIRPIEFIRKYPLIFQEFSPGGISIHPHIKLTSQVHDLDAEEQLIYESDSYKKNVADRVLKLLMISRIDKIPLKILDDIKFELGLPQDYVKCLVPDFPDCFRVIGNGKNKDLSSRFDSDLGLELVCWSNELAVSFMETKAASGKIEYKKGMPLAFPLQFSKGFEMDKQLKKWLNNWQKLPYISPYGNATHFGPNTDESDKWVAGVLHEMLNLFVSKKVERDTLLLLGEWLGIRSRFKRALLHHPGIFYLSSKMGSCTVVLKEAYKRGMLIGRSPMEDIRNRYVHLMTTVSEDHKAISVPGGSKQQVQKGSQKPKEQCEKDNNEDTMGVNGMDSDMEDDVEYDYDDDDNEEDDVEYDDDDNEEEESESKLHVHRKIPNNRSSINKVKRFNARESSKNTGRERAPRKHRGMTKDKMPPKDLDRTEKRRGYKFHKNLTDNLTSLKRNEKSFVGKRTTV